MRVWLIHPANQLPGDSWRDSRMHSICEELVNNGHECLWWTANFSHHTKSYRSDDWKDIEVKPNYRIRLVPTPSYRRHVGFARLKFHLIWSWRIYKRGLHEAPPDCIIVNDAPLGDSYFALRLARKFNAPLILDITDQWPEHFLLAFPQSLRGLANILFAPLYALRRYVRRRADAISALSEDYLDVVRKEIPNVTRKPLLTVYNGVDVREFTKILNEPNGKSSQRLGIKRSPDEVHVVYAGTLGKTYDIASLLSAVRLLEAKRSRIRFVIAGDGPLRPDVEQLALQEGSGMDYVGRLKPSELIKLYAQCDIGLCAYGPSSTVVMPDKVYDYMAAGLVVVNSLQGELADFLGEHQIGVQYRAGDPNSLAHALESLAADEQRRKFMARNSSEAAMTFDRHVQYRKFATLVEQVVSHK
jgi:glycosyltransferase involved in cell wall biosynthesis